MAIDRLRQTEHHHHHPKDLRPSHEYPNFRLEDR